MLTEGLKQMPRFKLAKNRMNLLIDKLQNRFDPETLEQGWEHYHKGFVAKLTLQHGYILHAIVHGVEPYDVKIDLEQFERSECTCPGTGECAHMAAAIFMAYTAHGRPELLLIQLKHTLLTRTKAVRAAGRAKSEERPMIPGPGDLPAQWHKVFDQRFYGFTLSHQHSVDTFYSAAVDSLLPFAQTWNEGIRSLYRLHIYLFILRKIDDFHQTHQTTYLSTYHVAGSRNAAMRALQEITQWAKQADPHPISRQHEGHWQDTIRLVREWSLRGKPGPVPWLDVYRTLWGQWFEQVEEPTKERHRLKHMLGPSGLPSRQEDILRLALAHFDISGGDDETAIHSLNRLHNRQIGDFLFVLQQLHQAEAPDRLLRWLRWLLPLMPRLKQDEFHTLCGYWVEAMKHQPSDEEWIRVMIAMLPRSYTYYTDYLMKHGRFRQWADLQLANSVDPANLYPDEIKAVEASDPELLLPIYHQSVERMIQEKTRLSYKTAVRLLRTLHLLYEKLDRLDRWQLYIELLSDKYSRLRAFQQELQKGQWLS